MWYEKTWEPGMSKRGYEGVSGLTEVQNPHFLGQAIFWRKVRHIFLFSPRENFAPPFEAGFGPSAAVSWDGLTESCTSSLSCKGLLRADPSPLGC